MGDYMSNKETVWEGNSLKLFEEKLSDDVKIKFSFDLDSISHGEEPYSKVKFMQGLGQGVMELIKNGKPAYRLVYTIRANKVHVLHVFSKTSTGTDSKHIETIKSRLKSL